MKALIYTGTKTLEFGEMPTPDLKPGEALVRVDSCGICGSDMHAWAGHDERRPAPLVLGHEVAGVVEQGAHVGARVTINPLAGCGTCVHCTNGRANLCGTRTILSMPPRQGGFAEYVVTPEQNMVVVPDSVPLAKASLAEPLACGWHGVRLGLKALDASLANAPTLVIGGGAIGVGAALSLRAQGVDDIVLVEPNEGRRARIIETTGLNAVADAASHQNTFGLVIDGVGYAATRALAFAAVSAGGVIAHIGLGDREGGVDVRRATLQEITFIGTYTYTPDDFRATAQAIFEGRMGTLDWIEEQALEDGAAAFDQIAGGRALSPKIVLRTPH